MTSPPRRVDGLETQECEDGIIVYDTRESRAHYLNHTAVLVLELCNGQRSATAIAELVGKAFGLSAPPRREVDAILSQMRDEGLVVTQPRRANRRGQRPAHKLKHFPHCLWINLDRERARKRYMEKHLSAHGVHHTRISAYDGSREDLMTYLTHPGDRCDLSNAELGATLSHLKAVRYFLDHIDAEHVVIAEDDVDLSICRFWEFDWDYVMAHLPSDWDVVQFAVICWPRYLITRIHPRQPHDWSAACYLLSRHHAQKLMALYERSGKYKIDNGPKPLVEQVIYDSGKTYSIPLVLYRLDFRSSIHQEHVENIHAQSRQAIHEWWSARSAHVTQERLFVLDAPDAPPSPRAPSPVSRPRWMDTRPSVAATTPPPSLDRGTGSSARPGRRVKGRGEVCVEDSPDTEYATKRMSLITAIKDRAESLEAAFDTWINIRGISQIVIVDWSSTDTSIIEKVARRDPRVLVARVENEIYFNHTRTRNLGVNLSNGEIIVATDADIMIHPRLRRLFSALNADDNMFYRGWTPGGYGTMVVRRSMLDAVGGYDERMEGWGGSDDDLYLRLSLQGFQFTYIPEGLLTHIDHSEEARHINMMIRGRKESQQRNADIVRQHGLWSKDLYASTHKQITATLWSSLGYLETRRV